MTRPLTSYHRTVSNDLFDKATDFAGYTRRLRAHGTYGFQLVLRDLADGYVDAETVDGDRRRVVNGASNDYLGLSNDPRVVDAVCRAIAEFGVGACGAAMLNGNTPEHRAFESELAASLGTESAMLAPAGYAAMQAACAALLTHRDVVFADQACHDSINTGIRLSGAEVVRYRHRDLDHLTSLLEARRTSARGALIVSDGVFSVDGAVADVDGLVDLAARFDSRLFVDDAHGVGVLGDGGGVATGKGVDLVGGTLSKSLASHGGFLAGDAETIDYIRVFGGSSCATTNLSVANVAAARSALRLSRTEPHRRERVRAIAHRLRSRLRDAGIEVLDTPSSIIGLVCGADDEVFRSWRALFDQGVLGHPLPFPIAPFGRATLRVRLTATTSDDALEHLGRALVRCFAPDTDHESTNHNHTDDREVHHVPSA